MSQKDRKSTYLSLALGRLELKDQAGGRCGKYIPTRL